MNPNDGTKRLVPADGNVTRIAQGTPCEWLIAALIAGIL